MKKKILAIIIAVLVICLPLTACGEKFKGAKVEGTYDDSYVVVSNGGSAVQYGKYVFYINGYRGYEDEDGSENYWGNVVKGGLYRAELNGKDANFEYTDSFGVKQTKNSDGDSLKTFESELDVSPIDDEEVKSDVGDVRYDFVSEFNKEVTGYEKDDDGEIVYDDNNQPVKVEKWFRNVKTDLIASKTIGTSGYSAGGIFIYDDYIYYASPSNKQNRDESFEVAKTMFFRTSLDGTKTQRLYTSKEDTASSEYAFYKQNGKVYLVVHDGTSIISVTVENKVTSVKEIATDVTSVLFPTRSVYFKGIDTNQPEDFIYYTRAIDNSDMVRAGNVALCMRPDGSELIQILATGNNVTLKSVNNGYLFYQDERSGGNIILYSNLHNQLYGNTEGEDEVKAYSPTYRAAYDSKKDKIKRANGEKSALIDHQAGVALNIENISDYTTIYCYRPSQLSNQVYCVCLTSSKIDVFDGSELVNVFSGSVSNVYALKDNKIYFGDSSGNYYFTNAFLPAAQNTLYTIGESMSSSATFGLDVVGDFAVIFGEVDEYADDYTLFVNCLRLEFSGEVKAGNKDRQFVGVRSDDDKYDPDVELNPPEEESEDTDNENTN